MYRSSNGINAARRTVAAISAEPRNKVELALLLHIFIPPGVLFHSEWYMYSSLGEINN